MSAHVATREFRLAPMSTAMMMSTGLVLALPVAGALFGNRTTAAIGGLLMVALCALVWLWFRPVRFVVGDEGLRVKWALRSLSIPRSQVKRAEITGADALRGMRVGVGGFWGSYGSLVSRNETVAIYISRRDVVVRIERLGGRTLLITPENPEEFVAAVNRMRR